MTSILTLVVSKLCLYSRELTGVFWRVDIWLVNWKALNVFKLCNETDTQGVILRTSACWHSLVRAHQYFFNSSAKSFFPYFSRRFFQLPSWCKGLEYIFYGTTNCVEWLIIQDHIFQLPYVSISDIIAVTDLGRYVWLFESLFTEVQAVCNILMLL